MDPPLCMTGPLALSRPRLRMRKMTGARDSSGRIRQSRFDTRKKHDRVKAARLGKVAQNLKAAADANLR
jgi:hypothetical protein